MKKLFAILFVLVCIPGVGAQAAVYDYAGLNFTDFQGATYTTAMRVTGTIVTSAPIPSNAVGFDARGIVTSWSFSDGVKTVDNSNGVLHATRFDFWTDANGNITVADIIVILNPIATAVGQIDDLVWVTQSFDEGTQNVQCGTVSQGVCTDWNFQVGNWEAGWVNSPGNWSTQQPPVPPVEVVGVPTMSAWAALLLILLLGVLAFARQRRIVKR